MKKIAKKIYHQFRYPYTFTHPDLVKDGAIRFHINNPVEQFRLQKFGGEKDQLEGLLDMLREDDVFYDIGASVGAWSIPAAKKAAKGTVFSFEPDPENQDRLKRNYELNGITNFQIMPFAVGDREGELELFTAGAYAASPSLRPVNKISTSLKVKIKTIDGLIATKTIPSPTVVKIDIEGAEMMALKGMYGLLSGPHKPRVIWVELHPLFLPSFDTNLTAIFGFLIGHGYEINKLASREDQVICDWVLPSK